MPIYEYRCEGCAHEFETLVRGEARPACPECASEELERLMSLPRVKSSTTRDLAMRAAKKRDAGQAKDRMHERIRYEESHDRHG
ncbi:MAG: zinc ribbon domain-containing protein [Gemmatimonadetes bacterium]|nr:zinc ribbon domain-containing protein [Gemmatimonadota bacterium]